MPHRPDSRFRTGPQVAGLYDRLAPLYDRLAAPYDWIGGRRLQRDLIDALDLRAGDTVVDLGTGSGWNLVSLARAVGPTGRVVGYDISAGMLERAHERVREEGLANVELRRSDSREVDVPSDTAAVISAFSMEMVPDHDDVIARLVDQLHPGTRIGLVGLREPSGWPEWLIRLVTSINAPFGVGPEYREVQPWTSIQGHLVGVDYREAMAGTVYSAIGRVPGPTTPDRP
ncbi:Methyltransferase type 11 [Euzebya pacifica]|uniref:Methyltransferase type 11 n=1 Tax=Euzebya pacifica TaxID=1608957 RepID=A0A346XRS8_9ACTN|nr:methyltransferase domain-containing protein [Euzebya pacifica]AXV04925.1 Methyltransferase type 11 [Euzebya pacifica]